MHSNSRWLILASTLTLGAGLLGSCSDDTPASPGTGGTAGSAGSAGAGDSAGSAGAPVAGSGGASGSSATAGSAAGGGAAGSGVSDAGPEATTPEAGAAMAHLRVAHLAPDAPAVDVCLRAHSAVASAPFTVGPVLKSIQVTTGLAYSKVTAYLDVPAVQLDVRIVAPNATDCSTSLAGLPDVTDLPVLPAGAYVTVAAVGLLAPDAGAAFGLKPFVDEHTVAADKIKLRFVHTSPRTPNVDVGLGTAESFMPLFTNVAYPNATATLETAPVSGVTVSARATGATSDALVLPGVSLAGGTITSVFAIGLLGSTTTPLKALVCSDLDVTTAPLSNCTALP